MKVLRSIISFYKSYAAASILCSIVSVYFIVHKGMEYFAPMFWGKIITSFIILLSVNSFKKNEFYYFLNLGISKNLLWISSLLFDIILYVFILITAFKYYV